MNKIIDRPKYMNWLQKNKDVDFVKVLTGVRRSGKTTLLSMFEKKLIESGVSQNNIIHINFEDLKNDKYRNQMEFISYVESHIKNEQRYYLLVDEIQELQEWARTINSIRATLNIDIYLTGSNSRIFLTDDLTYMTGRFTSLEVYPLSFAEFLEFNKNKEYKHLAQYYEDFIESSFPGVAISNEMIVKDSATESMYMTILEKDVFSRGQIRNDFLFKRIVNFIFDSVGKPISVNKIVNYLKSNQIEGSAKAIENYLSILQQSYLIYLCQAYDDNGKKLLKTNGKFYSVDLGFMKMGIGKKEVSRGRQLENFVFLELKKEGWTVHSLRVNREYEIDFVASKKDKKIFIQVTESMTSEDVASRESRPFKYLNEIGDRFILSMDFLSENHTTYIKMNVFDFVLEVLPNL